MSNKIFCINWFIFRVFQEIFEKCWKSFQIFLHTVAILQKFGDLILEFNILLHHQGFSRTFSSCLDVSRLKGRLNNFQTVEWNLFCF